MKTILSVSCCLALLAVLGSLLPAAESPPRSWNAYMPPVFKVPEAVMLERNPFQGTGRALPAPGIPLGTRNVLAARLTDQVRKGVRGLVVSADHPCVLFGGRIVSIGQTLELPVEDQGGRRTLALRLRSVSRDQLGFLADETGARLLGAEQWTCTLRAEAVP